MRNPKRIKYVMRLVGLIWEAQPDTRFNQLVYNLQREYKDGGYVKKAYDNEVGWGMTEVTYPDLFSVEDEPFIEFLEEKVKEFWAN